MSGYEAEWSQLVWVDHKNDSETELQTGTREDMFRVMFELSAVITSQGMIPFTAVARIDFYETNNSPRTDYSLEVIRL
jgi:hypothetical protein